MIAANYKSKESKLLKIVIVTKQRSSKFSLKWQYLNLLFSIIYLIKRIVMIIFVVINVMAKISYRRLVESALKFLFNFSQMNPLMFAILTK